MTFRRYALYFVAGDSELSRFGAAWLGWDADAGAIVPHPELPLPMAEITEAPRKYGFHGTLHWPFRLKGPVEENCIHFREQIAAFCASRAPIVLDAMELARLGRFLALVPAGDTAALTALAADLVRTVEAFRHPPDEAELIRRQKPHLSARQKELLTRWGYPYVMDQFRFHMTLTGRLKDAQLAQVEEVLTEQLAGVVSRPFVIDAISVMGEDEAGYFHVIERVPMTG